MAKKLGEKDNNISDLEQKLTPGVDATLDEAVGGDTEPIVKAFTPTPQEFKEKQQKAAEYTKQLLSNKEAIEREKALRDAQTNTAPDGNTLLSQEDYEGFSPDIKTFGRRAQGLTSASVSNPTTINQTDDGSDGAEFARAGTAVDIAKLDESMIMMMPYIKATSNIIPGILFLKPKRGDVRFRWVNFKNFEGGNYQRYRALGYENATLDDIDLEKTPVGENCVDGTRITWYDVILMKINVFVLMGLYKANIMASLEKVGRFQANAKSQAKEEFNNLLYNELVQAGKYKGQAMVSAYKRLQQECGKSLVSFYVPGLDDKSDKDYESDSGDIMFVNPGDGVELPGGVADGSYAGIGAKVQGFNRG